MPVLLALSLVADDADTPRELHQLLAQVGRGVAGTTLTLGPLSTADLHELAAALAPWCRTPEAVERLTRRLQHESAGQPLLAVTLLRGLEAAASVQEDALRWPPVDQTLDSPLPMGIPQLIRSTVLAQLGKLDPEARDLLARASLLGARVDLPLLSGLTGLEAGTLVDHLAQAERVHLIRAEGDGYLFPSPLMAQVMSHGYLTPGQARQVRRRAAELLEDRPDPGSRLLRLDLLVRLGQWSSAAELAVAVAEEGLRSGDRRAVRRSLQLAEAHQADLPEAAQATLRRLREEWTSA